MAPQPQSTGEIATGRIGHSGTARSNHAAGTPRSMHEHRQYVRRTGVDPGRPLAVLPSNVVDGDPAHRGPPRRQPAPMHGSLCSAAPKRRATGRLQHRPLAFERPADQPGQQPGMRPSARAARRRGSAPRRRPRHPGRRPPARPGPLAASARPTPSPLARSTTPLTSTVVPHGVAALPSRRDLPSVRGGRPRPPQPPTDDGASWPPRKASTNRALRRVVGLDSPLSHGRPGRRAAANSDDRRSIRSAASLPRGMAGCSAATENVTPNPVLYPSERAGRAGRLDASRV